MSEFGSLDGLSEIWAGIVFVFALMGLTGMYFLGTSAHKAYKLSGESQQGMDQKTMLSQLIGCILGVCMMSPILFLTLSGNTVFDDGLETNTVTAISEGLTLGEVPDLDGVKESLESDSTLLNSKELDEQSKRYWILIYSLIMLAGAISLYRGFRIWWVSMAAGSDMGGTSAYMKGGTIFFHLFGGLAMLNITMTLKLTQATFDNIMSFVLIGQ